MLGETQNRFSLTRAALSASGRAKSRIPVRNRSRMSRTIARLGVSAACALLLAGCITHESNTTRDAPRRSVEFENDSAARIFYETLSQGACKDSQGEATTKFEIPVVFEYKRHVVTGPNTAFNRAVELCDTNHDGKITEAEARIFAAWKK